MGGVPNLVFSGGSGGAGMSAPDAGRLGNGAGPVNYSGAGYINAAAAQGYGAYGREDHPRTGDGGAAVNGGGARNAGNGGKAPRKAPRAPSSDDGGDLDTDYEPEDSPMTEPMSDDSTEQPRRKRAGARPAPGGSQRSAGGSQRGTGRSQRSAGGAQRGAGGSKRNRADEDEGYDDGDEEKPKGRSRQRKSTAKPDGQGRGADKSQRQRSANWTESETKSLVGSLKLALEQKKRRPSTRPMTTPEFESLFVTLAESGGLRDKLESYKDRAKGVAAFISKKNNLITAWKAVRDECTRTGKNGRVLWELEDEEEKKRLLNRIGKKITTDFTHEVYNLMCEFMMERPGANPAAVAAVVHLGHDDDDDHGGAAAMEELRRSVRRAVE